MTAALRSQTSDLTIGDGQTFWSEKQIAALGQLGVRDAPNGDLAVFFHQSVRTGLDPFAKQIYMIGRWSQDGTKWTIQTAIDGYRLIARRVADQRRETFSYEDTLWCGSDGQWVDVWLADTPPAAAKVTVLRGGQRFSAIALWREYVQLVKDKKTNELKPNSMWARMGSGQLAKCAEALALRKAFPQDMYGIYTDEEMAQADREEPESTPIDAGRGSVSRLSSVVPEVADEVDAEVVAEESAEPKVPTKAEATSVIDALGRIPDGVNPVSGVVADDAVIEADPEVAAEAVAPSDDLDEIYAAEINAELASEQAPE